MKFEIGNTDGTHRWLRTCRTLATAIMAYCLASCSSTSPKSSLPSLAGTAASDTTAHVFMNTPPPPVSDIPEPASKQSPIQTPQSVKPQPSTVTPAEFANADWINVDKLDDTTSTQVMLNTLATIFVQNRIIGISVKDQFDAQWQREKERINNQWIDQFFNLEDTLSLIFQNYTETIRKIQETEINIQQLEAVSIRQLEAVIKNIEQTIGYNKADNERIRQAIERLTENYRWRLAGIPYSLLLIGKVDYSTSENPETFKQALSWVLRKKAIEIVNGRRIYDLEVVKTDSTIKQFVEKPQEGHALVSDSYQSAQFESLNTYRFFQLLRIEVYPFYRRQYEEDSESHSLQLEQTDPELANRIMCFGWDEYSFAQYRLHFTESARAHIRNQINDIDDSNIRAEQKIQEIWDGYKKSKGDYEKRLQDNEANIAGQGSQKQLQSQDLAASKSALANLQQQLSQIVDHLHEAEQAYKEHYQSRISVVNKSEQAFLVPAESPQNTFKRMIIDSKRILQDLKRQSQRSAIIYSAESDKFIRLEASQISYTPQLTGFRFLYVGHDEVDRSLFFNVAYRVKWTPVASQR